MREGIAGDIRQILQVHGLVDILVQPGYGSGDIGIEAVDIAVIDRGEKLEAEQKADEELGSDLDGPGRHIAEEVEGGAQILDMCISRLKMTMFKIQQSMAEHIAELFVESQHIIRILGADLEGIEFTGELGLAAVAVDLKGKSEKHFVSGVCIALQRAVFFDLRMALSLDHAVDLNDVGVVVHDQRGGGSRKVPVGYVPEPGDFVFLPYYRFVFLSPGKFVESFVSFVHMISSVLNYYFIFFR